MQLRSRNNNDFSSRYLGILKALSAMPDETVIDGEVVALDEDGRPRSICCRSTAPAYLLHLRCSGAEGQGRDGRVLDRVAQAKLLEKHVFPKMSEPIRYSPVLEGNLKDLIQSVKAVKAQRLEGLVAKRKDQVRARPALRRVAEDAGQPGAGARGCRYTPSPKNLDALVVGYYDGPRLMYVARTRNGFTPASRAELFKKLKPLEIKDCPFANLPEKYYCCDRH